MTDKGAQVSAAAELKFSLSVADTQWSREAPPQVTLRVENLSGGPVEVKGSPVFSLTKLNAKDQFEKDRETYLAYANLSGETPPARVLFDYEFGPGYAEETKPNLASLKWASAISAQLPSKDLFAAVPPGDYDLSFTFALRSGTVRLGDSAKELRAGQTYTTEKVRVHIK